MPTIGWHDVSCTESTGPVQFRSFTVHIAPEHVARWKSDPDGRFKLRVSTLDPMRAELEKFYPSL